MAYGNGSKSRFGEYALGRLLGEGKFGKVRFARNIGTGKAAAIKIIDKESIFGNDYLMNQVRNEISAMVFLNHPNIIHMHEVITSKSEIYIVMEFVSGGELSKKLNNTCGRLEEDEARKYFRQLINAVNFCHICGVYHRDLKPSNLLVDANGVLKVADFGLCALPRQVGEDGLLHSTCGTPMFTAPEKVLSKGGYDGAKADVWSCGITLFYLMAGYYPFKASNFEELLEKMPQEAISCPPWFSTHAKTLIQRILDPNPLTRITIDEILDNKWFNKGYRKPVTKQDEDDIHSVSNNSESKKKNESSKPVPRNAFKLISAELNLGDLFEKQGDVKRETSFTSAFPANEIVSKIEKVAGSMGFDVRKNNLKMKLDRKKFGRKGRLTVSIELFEVKPSLHVVELRKTGGDTLEFCEFNKNLLVGLKDIVWKKHKCDDKANNTDGENKQDHSPQQLPTRKLQYDWWIQMSIYSFFVLAGMNAGTLLGRVYFDKGGSSKWMATLVQVVGFPILFPFQCLNRNTDTKNITVPSSSRFRPALALVYVSLGIFLAAICMLYSIGLQYLPVTTYTLICASQLGFNALFSFFLNRQKFTSYIVNSIVILTISSTLLVFQTDSDGSVKTSKNKYVIGFLCTLAASAGYGLILPLTQLASTKIIKKETLRAIVDMAIYQCLVATFVIVVGLFASGEWRTLTGEMNAFKTGKVSYVMNLFWTAIAWQAFNVGCIGLIFKISSLFSNVISILGLPVAPILAVIFLNEKITGLKGMSMILAIWGFVSYMYHHYLEDLKTKKSPVTDQESVVE